MAFQKEELLERFDNDLELIVEVLEIFKDSSQQNINAIQEALQEKDDQKLTLNAHSLKGAASNFSPDLATQKAAALEEKGKNSDFTETEQLLSELKEEVAQLITHLAQMTA